MVCLGNICRSPLAEGILQSKLPNDKFFVDSAGTSGFHNGNPPDIRSIEVAKKYGLNISNQTSRLFEGYDFELFDHIFVMDQSNYNAIIRQAQNDKHIDNSDPNLHTILDFNYEPDLDNTKGDLFNLIKTPKNSKFNDAQKKHPLEFRGCYNRIIM